MTTYGGRKTVTYSVEKGRKTNNEEFLFFNKLLSEGEFKTKMMRMKKVLASVLSIAMVGTVLPVTALDVEAAANAAPSKPDNLRTELLKEAYGIDTKNPAFSWVVNDSDSNEYQTAYRIVVSETSDLKGEVYDTDWVTSGESSYVHVDALETRLQDNELYYWQVQTKDASGAESPLSEPAVFMTDIASEWQSMSGIWSVPGANATENDAWKDYEVEQTITITGTTGRFGLLLRMQSNKNGYMAQFDTADNCINLHKVNAGAPETAFATLELADSDITLPAVGSSFKCKIKAEGSILSFALDTGEGYKNAGDVSISSYGNIKSGKIGYRTATWSDEAGTVDDITVTSLNDEEGILYTEDFSESTDVFEGCTVADGVLKVGKDVFTIVEPTRTKYDWADYTVEQTLKISTNTTDASKSALGMLVRMQDDKSGYMVQIRTVDNQIKVHKIDAGEVNVDAFEVIELSEEGITLPTDGSEFGYKMTVSGSYISISLNTGNGYQNLDSVDISGQGNLLSGKFGYRTGNSESGSVDNLTVITSGGSILLQEDFEESSAYFSDCTVSDGVLNIGTSKFSMIDDSSFYTTGISEQSNYTIEQKLGVTAGDAMAVLLRMTGTGSGYMAQYRTVDNVIKVHKINDNREIVVDAFATLTLSDSGITLPTDGSEFKTKIRLDGSEITFYVQEDVSNGKESYVEAGVVDISAQGNISKGTFGYRTGRTEAGTADDVAVADFEGNVLYTSDFSEDAEGFGDLTASNGKLVIGNSVFSTYGTQKELSNFAFIRSPKLAIEDTSTIDKAIVSAACRGTGTDRGSIFDLFMNGKSIGAGSARELKAVGSFGGTSNFRKVYYNSYDVTELLTEGDANVIAAVGNSRDVARSILIQMTVFYKDGTKKILTNSSVDNSGWKTLDGTSAFADDGSLITTGYVSILHDNYDAKYYPSGWNTVSYDDSAWADAQVTFQLVDATSGKPDDGSAVLYPYSAENVLRRETNEAAKRVYRNSNGNLIIDLGKEIVGGLKVNINSNSEQKVTVRRGEEMNADGTVKYQLTAVPVYEDVWKLQKGTNNFETVTMRTFRYVELIGLDDTTEDAIIANQDMVKGWAMEQAFDESVSAFEATDGSDAATLLNRLYELSKYTIQATNQDVYTDSQARERAPYEGDLLVNSNTSYSVIDQYALARHSNEWLIDNPTWPNDYSLFSVEMAYWDYIYTGNTDSIQEYYDALKLKLTTKVAAESAEGLIRANGSQAGNTAIIDWPTSERDGYQNGYYDVIFNAEYVGIYQYMAQISNALGETEDAKKYAKKAETLKETLLTYAYDSENGCFYDALNEDLTPVKHSSTHASAYALTYGVFEDQKMADELSYFVYSKCKDEFKGSVYFTYFILKGLYNGNHGEYAEKLITNPKVGTDVKTFASVLDDLNCTITPEAWGHKHKNNMTLSHPWGASPGCSIVQGMFGITPVKAGFEEFNIKLQPGGIASASVTAPSIRGNIEVSYENGNTSGVLKNAIRAKVSIPANTTAHVYVPIAGNGDEVLLVDGIETDAAVSGAFMTVELGSGTHILSVSSETSDATVPTKIAEFTFDSTDAGFTGEKAKGENSSNAVLSEDAVYGKALSLDGTGANYVTVTDLNGNSLLKGCEELTVSYWSKTAKNTGNHKWAFYAAPNNSTQSYQKECYLGILDHSESVKAERYNNAGSRPEGVANAEINNTEWKYVTVTYGTDGTTVYINGEKAAEDTIDYALEDILGTNGVLYIGKANWESGQYFTGLLDEFSIYNYAMDASEAKALYKAEKPENPRCVAQFTFDDASTGFTSDEAKAVNAGTLELSSDGVSNKALSLDGTGSNYLTVTDKDGNPLLTDSKAVSISYWSRIKEGEKNVDWAFFVAQNDNTQKYNYENYIGIKDGASEVRVERYLNNGTRPASVTTAEDSTAWKHVTVVFDEADTTVYINGQEKNTAESSLALTDILGENSVFYIGKANWGTGEYFKGLIDEVSIYNYALSETEIGDAYTAGKELLNKKASDAVIALIQNIGEVSADAECKARIDAARAAYDALSDEQKALIDAETYKILEDAQIAYNAGISTADNAKAAQVVINLISQIGDIDTSKECGDNITAAEKAYASLTDEQKALVSNYSVLTAAREEYERMVLQETEDADKAKAQNVMDLIAQIGEVNTSDTCKSSIDMAKAAYELLTEAQKSLVTNKGVLDAAEAKYNMLKAQEAAGEQAAADAAAAQAVINKIAEIGEVNTSAESKAKIDLAEYLYNSLSEVQKALVTNKEALDSAKTTYDALKAKEAADQAAKEQAEKEAAEKAAKEQAEKEAAEKAAKEQAEKEAAEKAAKEQAEKEAAEKAAKEQAEKEAAQAGTIAIEQTKQTITTANTDKGDVKGSAFAPLKLQAVGKNKSVKLSWSKMGNADGYQLYGAACGKKMKLVKELPASKKSFTVKKLKKGKYYKYMLVAYKNIYGEKRTIATTKTVHICTKGGKYGNPTGIKYGRKNITVKKNKTFKLKPQLKYDTKVKTHIAKFRYESSNTKIATVSKNGKIKGIKKGSCYVYIYTQSGLYHRVKVKVK